MTKKFTAVSLNCGLGSQLKPLSELGYTLRLVQEPRLAQVYNSRLELDTKFVEADSRWFYNRKVKGTQAFLDLAGLQVGELDLFETVSDFQSISDKKANNLFDAFGIARRIQPKVVLAYAAPEWMIANNKAKDRLQRFERFLDFMRFTKTEEPRDRAYFVDAIPLNFSDFGAGVNQTVSVILGVRKDIAENLGVTSDLDVRFLFSNLKAKKPKLIDWGEVDDEEDEFWLAETRAAKGVEVIAKPTEPIPNPNRYKVLTPDGKRMISLSELKQAYGVKRLKLKGSDIDRRRVLADSVYEGLAKEVIKSVVTPILTNKAKVKPPKDEALKKVKLAETLLKSEASNDGVRSYSLETDVGDWAAKQMTGNKPSLRDVDYIFDANHIGESFIVHGGFDEGEGRQLILGAISRRAFSSEFGGEVKRAINSLNKPVNRTEARTEAAVDFLNEKTLNSIATYRARGVEVETNSPEDEAQASRYRKRVEKGNRKGEWDTWRTNPVPAMTVGWMPDKLTREVKPSANMKENTEAVLTLSGLNRTADNEYRRLANEDFVKQRKFMKSRIPEECSLGGSVFTTMSVNAYEAQDMSQMGYHIDNGDINSGLTTISVFEEGEYSGGYFIIPRFRVAFRVGDGDVFVSDAREVHGVSQIEGQGKRYSVVSYTKTTLGYKANADGDFPAKSLRPKTRIDNYRIAIDARNVSVKGMSENSLAWLLEAGVKPSRLSIFTDDEEHLVKLKRDKKLKGVSLVLAKSAEQLWANYRENTCLTVIPAHLKKPDILNTTLAKDDELEGEDEVGGVIDTADFNDFYRQLVYPVFHVLRENSCYLASFNGENRGWAIGNFTAIHGMYSAVVRHDKELFGGRAKRLKPMTDKDSFNLSLNHFKKDGRTARISLFRLRYQSSAYRHPDASVLFVIPSYKRYETVKEKTLSFLKSQGIPASRIHVWVNDKEKGEYNKYRKALSGEWFEDIQIKKGVPTISAQRNFIEKYYPEGTPIFSMDDDIVSCNTVAYKNNRPDFTPVTDFLNEVVNRGFSECQKTGATMFGIYAAANPMFMDSALAKGDVQGRICYIIGSSYGFYADPSPELDRTVEHAEDFMASCRRYVRDGIVIRLAGYTMVSDYRGEAGGLQASGARSDISKQDAGVNGVYEEYPDITTRVYKKGLPEIKFRSNDTKYALKYELEV